MKTLLNLIKYYIWSFLHSAKGLTSMALTFIVIAILIQGPFTISNYSLTCIAIFIMSAFTSNTFFKEEAVEEELLFLQSNCAFTYYISKHYFLLIMNIVYSLFATLFPFVRNINTIFRLPFDLFLCIFITHLACSICGSELASLLHPRICKKQKNITLVLIIIIICYLIFPYIAEAYTMQLLGWIVAPINVLMKNFDSGNISLYISCVYSVIVMFYGALYAVFQMWLLKRRKF